MFVDMNQYYSKTFFFRETYRGSHAFSEPETRAIAQFILGKMKTQQIKVTSFNVLHMNEIRDIVEYEISIIIPKLNTILFFRCI